MRSGVVSTHLPEAFFQSYSRARDRWRTKLGGASMFGKKREPQTPQNEKRTGRAAGYGARERQQELARAAPVKTFFTRLFKVAHRA